MGSRKATPDTRGIVGNRIVYIIKLTYRFHFDTIHQGDLFDLISSEVENPTGKFWANEWKDRGNPVPS